jgi:hypothetical protein
MPPHRGYWEHEIISTLEKYIKPHFELSTHLDGTSSTRAGPQISSPFATAMATTTFEPETPAKQPFDKKYYAKARRGTTRNKCLLTMEQRKERKVRQSMLCR